MNKNFAIFLIIIITGADYTYSWDSTAAKYYPLAIGNQWSYHKVNRTGFNCIQFTTESDYIISVVSDTLMTNGKRYFKLRSPAVNYTSYERIDSSTMNVYKYTLGGECIIDSLFARINNNFYSCRESPGSQVFQFNVQDTNSIIFAGSLRKAKAIIGGLAGLNYTLMYGVGRFRESVCEGGFGALITLNGCVIDGILYGQMVGLTYSISGIVRFQDNNQPVTSGYVKALKHSSLGGNVIVIDSVRIQPNGSYTLTQIPQDTVDLMAFDDDEAMHSPLFVPTYYPSTIEWQQAVPLYPASNLTNINIGVYRISNDLQSSGIISGGVYLNADNPLYPLKDAIIYAKIGNVFKGYSISSGTGAYAIDYLPQGTYNVVCSRMGYTSAALDQQLGAGNLNNINFYFGVPIGISETGVPIGYSLLQNYPNPFNPVTKISFEIQKAENVILKIFDANGKEITVLLNGKLSAGPYSADWDAVNYPSGVYFYQLSSESFTETKKMVLLK